MLKFSKNGKVVMTESDNGELRINESEKGEWIAPAVSEGGEILSDPSTGAAITTGPWDYGLHSNLVVALMGAMNGHSMAKDAFFVVHPHWQRDPKNLLKYPHHAMSETGKMVLHKQGLIQAAKDLRKNEPDNKAAMAHAQHHFAAMGLNWKEEVEDKFDLEG